MRKTIVFDPNLLRQIEAWRKRAQADTGFAISFSDAVRALISNALR